MNRSKKIQKAVGIFLVTVLILGAVLAPVLAPNDPIRPNPVNKLQGPSRQYPLGTDQMGRCILSRLLWGGRASLGYSFCVLAVALVLGTTVGLISGYVGGRTDRLLMGVTNAFMSVPITVVTLAISGILGASIFNLILAMGCIWWTTYARFIRGLVLEARERDYVTAAYAAGCTSRQVLCRHILKNIVDPILVLTTMDVGNAIISLAGYSFIGLGTQPPTPEWGVMLNDAKAYMQSQPQLMLYPGLAVALSVMAFNLLGESLKER